MEFRASLTAAIVAGCLTCTVALSGGYQGSIKLLDPALQERIQIALLAEGFDPGPIDGQYGPNTGMALIAFRIANDINEGDYNEVLTPSLAEKLLGVDLSLGDDDDDLTRDEQIEVLKQLGLTPSKDYWAGYIFPE